MTLTARALGAQTAKCAPATPACALQVRAQPVVQAHVRAFAQQVDVVLGDGGGHGWARPRKAARRLAPPPAARGGTRPGCAPAPRRRRPRSAAPRTGVVLDGRARPKPSAYSTRRPSMVMNSRAPRKWLAPAGSCASARSRSTRRAFSPSAVAQLQLGRADARRAGLRARPTDRRCGSGSRAGARRRTAPSSKPYQRSLKKRWPLISPANGAPVSLSLRLDQRVAGASTWWAGRRSAATQGAIWRVHLTS